MPATGSTATSQRRHYTATFHHRRLHRVSTEHRVGQLIFCEGGRWFATRIPLSLYFLALDHVLGFTISSQMSVYMLDLWLVDPVMYVSQNT